MVSDEQQQQHVAFPLPPHWGLFIRIITRTHLLFMGDSSLFLSPSLQTNPGEEWQMRAIIAHGSVEAVLCAPEAG